MSLVLHPWCHTHMSHITLVTHHLLMTTLTEGNANYNEPDLQKPVANLDLEVIRKVIAGKLNDQTL